MPRASPLLFFSLIFYARRNKRPTRKGVRRLVRQEGLEPPTYWFVASHSIQLSYCRLFACLTDSFCILPHFSEDCKPFFQFFQIF